RDTDRDFWLDPEAARQYGLVDEILRNPNAPLVSAGSNGTTAR
ncbi:MAG: ATP-dependent Clp protease proteolytic subunit, partial [Thermoflexaceae bacterium]|nr:ATP-dependent Clp protease proteolytic subunit [Thermoflexaceae bacterium]